MEVEHTHQRRRGKQGAYTDTPTPDLARTRRRRATVPNTHTDTHTHQASGPPEPFSFFTHTRLSNIQVLSMGRTHPSFSSPSSRFCTCLLVFLSRYANHMLWRPPLLSHPLPQSSDLPFFFMDYQHLTLHPHFPLPTYCCLQSQGRDHHASKTCASPGSVLLGCLAFSGQS